MEQTSAAPLSHHPQTNQPCNDTFQSTTVSTRGWRVNSSVLGSQRFWLNSQVVVRRKRRSLCVQPCLPPLRCCRSLWVLDIGHIAQFLLSVQQFKKLKENLYSSTLSHHIHKMWGFTGEEVVFICSFTCSLANTPDLWLPKPYVCMALSSSSELSLYTSCSTCQSNSSSSSSSSSPALSLHPFETLRS